MAGIISDVVLMIAFLMFLVAPERIGESAARVVQGYEAVMEDGR